MRVGGVQVVERAEGNKVVWGVTVYRPIARGQDFDSFSVWNLIHRSEGGGYKGMANPWWRKAALIRSLLFESKHAPHDPITQDRDVKVD